MRKKGAKNDARKNMKFRLIFDAKMGGLGVQKHKY